MYTSMAKAGVLDAMKILGVQYVQVFGVDNVLARLGDPTWAGYVSHHGFDVSNKVSRKRGPHEKVGVMCSRDGQPGVVEYSEISKEMAEMVDANGDLVYGLGNVAMHMFSTEFLSQIGCSGSKKDMPIHVARKKIPCVNEKGETTKPKQPNGIKLEYFIFDSFKYAKKMNAYECLREEEFAPIKNADGQDSPATAKLAMNEWLKRACMSPAFIYAKGVSGFVEKKE